MTSRPNKALLYILLVISLLLSSCQAGAELRTATAVIDPPGETPTPETPPVILPTSTGTPAVTPTRPDILGATQASLRGLIIDFWHPWQGDLAKQAQELVDTFNRSNEWGMNVRVRAWYSAGELFDALNAGIRSKSADMPELVAATTEQLASWSQGSSPALVDLSPYVADPQAGLSEADIQAYPPIFWEQDQSIGRRFGIPALRSARVLFYNRSWANELGFDAPPANPEAFKTQACAAAKKNNTSGVLDLYGTGGWVVDNDALTTLSWLGVFGANPIPSAEGAAYTFESKEAENALAFLRGMIDDGCAWISRNAAPYDYFASRKALFYSGTLADIYAQARWQNQVNSKDQWTVLPYRDAAGKPLVLSSGYSYGILASKPEAQLGAWFFIRWLSKAENAVRLARALPSLPVTRDVAAQMKASGESFPWDLVLPLVDAARPAPGLASWREARRPLEDAAWQIYHQPAEGLTAILPMLDDMLKEILKPR